MQGRKVRVGQAHHTAVESLLMDPTKHAPEGSQNEDINMYPFVHDMRLPHGVTGRPASAPAGEKQEEASARENTGFAPEGGGRGVSDRASYWVV